MKIKAHTIASIILAALLKSGYRARGDKLMAINDSNVVDVFGLYGVD